jgi:hypothetical protein
MGCVASLLIFNNSVKIPEDKEVNGKNTLKRRMKAAISVLLSDRFFVVTTREIKRLRMFDGYGKVHRRSHKTELFSCPEEGVEELIKEIGENGY